MKLNRKAVTTAVVAALLVPSVGFAGIPPIKGKSAKGPNIQRKKPGTTHLVTLTNPRMRLPAKEELSRSVSEIVKSQEAFLNGAVARQLKLRQNVSLLQQEYQAALGNFHRVSTLNNKNRSNALKERLTNAIQELNVLNDDIISAYEILQTSGIDENILPKEIQLRKAAQNNDLDAVKKWLEAGADPRTAVGMGLKNPEMTELLLTEALKNNFSYQADLTQAIRMDYAETVDVFVKVLKPNKEESLKWLQEAIGYHKFDIARSLMKQLKTKPTEEMAVAYIKSNDRPVLEFLVNEGKVNLNKQMRNGTTLMHEACRTRASLLPFLVNLGGDVNTIDAQGNTLLHISVFQAETIVQLRNLNANPQIRNNQKLTPSEYGLTLVMNMAFEEDEHFFEQIQGISPHAYLLRQFPKEMNALMEFDDVMESIEEDLIKEISTKSPHIVRRKTITEEELPVDPVLQKAESISNVNPNELPSVEE